MRNDRATRVVLDLSQRCIETAARREHRRLSDVILACDQRDPAQEERLGLLKAFLEQTNCSKLRAEEPRLSGGTAVHVEIWRSSSTGLIAWQEIL